MEIVKIELYPVEKGGKLKARAHVTLGDGRGIEICVKGFRVHMTEDGKIWIGPPSEKFMKGTKVEYKDTMWLNQSAQNLIYSVIVEKYKSQFENN